MAIILPEHLEMWSESKEAEGRLPELVHRLLAASIQLESPRFPIEKSTGLPGYDGVAKTLSRHPLIPLGDCVFEFGTDKDPMAKATKDYSKRSRSPLGKVPGKTNYIQISSRKWPGASAWAQQKSKTTKWKSVRAIGAIELANWLDNCPSVGRWASKYLFNSAASYGSIYVPQECFVSCAAGEDYLQFREALVTSNRAICPDIIEWLGNIKKEFAYEGDPWLVGALVYALTQKLKEPQKKIIESRSLFIHEPSKWDEILDNQKELWVVLGKSGNQRISYAIKDRHFNIIFPKGDISNAKLLVFQDPRLVGSAGIGRAPVAIGSSPNWLKDSRAGSNIGLWLAGSWVDGSGDMVVVNNLTGLEGRALEEFVRLEILQNGLPLKRIGNVVRVEMKPAYSANIFEIIGDSDLLRFSQACSEVLGEADPKLDRPKNERFYTPFNGVKRKYSGELRKGLSSTILLMADFIQKHISPPQKFRRTIDLVVRGLMENIDSWKDITKLSDIIYDLSEAAPDEFIGALDRVLKNNRDVFREMFKESPQIGESTYTSLMNSLVTLAWYPRTIAGVLILFAGLDELTPPGLNVYPQPKYAAVKCANLYLRNTAATQDQILDALNIVRNRYPDIWWSWAERLVGGGQLGVGDLDQPPPLLGIDNMEDLRQEFEKNFRYASARLFDAMFEEAGKKEERWAFLVSVLPYQSVDVQKLVLRKIKDWVNSGDANA